MTVAQLIDALRALPPEALVLIDSDGGLSLVAQVEFSPSIGPGAPAEVLLLPNMEE
jgi:hypothetical protein